MPKFTTSDAAERAEILARRCEAPHPDKQGWRARCPAHQGDSNTSLALRPDADRVLLHCFAGCTPTAIVQAMGLTMADLFLPPSVRVNGKRRITTVYDYDTADGAVLFQTVRYDPKAFRQRRPDPARPGAYVWNLDGIEPVLYRLPELLAAVQQGQTVWLVEGEKDVDALTALGLPATCNPMGAGKWRASYTEVLRGTAVMLLPDNDAPGERHAQHVAQALHGIAARVKVVALPHLPPHGDVSDWLRAGGTRANLEALAAAAPPWEPRDTTTEGQDVSTNTKRPAVVTMSTVQAEPIAWLWWPYLAVGKLCMLDGDPGIGKSLLMTQVATSLSRGYPLPDQQGKPTMQTGGPHATLLLSTEDGLADTLKPRLDTAGADCSKVHVLTGWLGPEDAWHAFTLQHIEVLEVALQRYQPRLVVIDPLQAYLGPIDMHRANETRPLLAALTRLGERYHCAMVCIRHPSKPGQGGGKAIHRGLGSIDFIGAARTGLFVEQHPTDSGKVLMAQSKSNIGRMGRTQVFSKHAGQFQWCGVSRLSAELMAGSGRGPDPHAFLEVVCWLEEHLTPGLPRPSKELEEELAAEGCKRDTIRRAKKALGIVSLRNGEGWDWQLPALPIIQPQSLQLLQSLQSLQSLHTLQEKQKVMGRSEDGRPPKAQGVEDVEETEVTEETEETVGVRGEADQVVCGEPSPSTQGQLAMLRTPAPAAAACPTCDHTEWLLGITSRTCAYCGNPDGPTPGEMLGTQADDDTPPF